MSWGFSVARSCPDSSATHLLSGLPDIVIRPSGLDDLPSKVRADPIDLQISTGPILRLDRQNHDFNRRF